jgi:glycogen phosphorylase
MESIKISYHRYLRHFLAKDDTTATTYDKYMALSYAVRSEMVDRWITSQRLYQNRTLRRIYFLSMEYIFGRSLKQNILSLDMEENVSAIAADLGVSLDELYEQEESFDLGNGGKARLAACMQDSMAAIGLPAMAYGLRYDYGLFRQEIENGLQVERPYDWLHKGHPWEIVRPEYCCEINFNGRTEPLNNADNPLAASWKDAECVVAIPYDFPIPGYHNQTVNTLRLWASRASEIFLPDYQNHQDYLRACDDTARSGTITKMLFPDEDVLRATELRLKQQFFLVSASLYDILRRYKRRNADLSELPERVVIQLSGSNCALAVPELMRRLVDLENMPFDKAWEIASRVFAYTSSAVSREGLESWPVYLITQVLPRHMQIIYEINQRHLDTIRGWHGGNDDLIRDLSLIQEGEVKRLKLGHLAVVGSYSVNGVSRSQAETLQSAVFPEFVAVSPQKFTMKTNGVSHRRWMLCANRRLTTLINSAIGDGWLQNPEELVNLEPFAQDNGFIRKLADIKMGAKKQLSLYVKKTAGPEFAPEALFDVQCKKIHQYKRQVLHVLNILSRYLRIKKGENPAFSRVHIFGGKAAPSDQLAKQIIRLVNVAADIVNNDPDTKEKMRVVFLPEYGVTLAEKVVPASDLSEQIATPGQEASGTGNVKFIMNGSLLMASKSGSNNEIMERIGAQNVFVFGRDVGQLPAFNRYQPYDIFSSNKHLAEIFKLLDDYINRHQGALCIRPLLSTLMDSDRYFVLLDFDDYIKKQDEADALYADTTAWMKKVCLCISRCGYFSIDRMVAEYASGIWKVQHL